MPPNDRANGFLLYCICRHGGADAFAGLTGVQEQAVETVSTDNLCAAVSALNGVIPGSRLTEFKRYGQVVAACHQNHVTIPMRYGSTFRGKHEVVCHLEEYATAYQTLLRKLTDCEEMGIRLLWPAPRTLCPRDLRACGKGSENNTAFQAPAFPGKAYLARQKERYGLTDGFIQKAEAVLLNWRESFKGLFVECRWDRPEWIALQKAPILSAYFLVLRKKLAAFQETFVRVCRQRPEKALLSGPWPPYNFVRQERSEANSHDATTGYSTW